MSAAATTHDHSHDHGHDHHELSFIKKYIWSTDHKVIGIQYAVSGLLFLLLGFFLMMLMRWSIAYPGQPIPGFGFVTSLPIIGDLFQEMIGRWAPGGVVNGELYNMLGAMHGTIMVFFGIVPVAFAAFGSTAASSATCAISPVLLNAVLIGLSTAGAFAGAAAFTVFFDAETGVVFFAVAIES